MHSTSNSQPILHYSVAKHAVLNIQVFHLSSLWLSMYPVHFLEHMKVPRGYLKWASLITMSPSLVPAATLEGKRFLDVLHGASSSPSLNLGFLIWRLLPLESYSGCRDFTGSWPLLTHFLSPRWVFYFQQVLLTTKLSYSYHLQYNSCVWFYQSGAICSPIHLIQCKYPMN